MMNEAFLVKLISRFLPLCFSSSTLNLSDLHISFPGFSPFCALCYRQPCMLVWAIGSAGPRWGSMAQNTVEFWPRPTLQSETVPPKLSQPRKSFGVVRQDPPLCHRHSHPSLLCSCWWSNQSERRGVCQSWGWSWRRGVPGVKASCCVICAQWRHGFLSCRLGCLVYENIKCCCPSLPGPVFWESRDPPVYPKPCWRESDVVLLLHSLLAERGDHVDPRPLPVSLAEVPPASLT